MCACACACVLVCARTCVCVCVGECVCLSRIGVRVHPLHSCVCDISSSLAADIFTKEDGTPFKLYGDSIYRNSAFMASPMKLSSSSPEMLAWNRRMSAERITAEWTIGKVTMLFKFLGRREQHKVHQNALAWRYLTAIVLTNCHTCLYGCQTSKYFKCYPPSLDEYLSVFPGYIAAEVAV